MLWPSVRVVIATYDGREHLVRCLSALDALDYPRERLQVIVVDNASRDGTAEIVGSQFPSVRLIRNDSNLGFAAATNRGFADPSTEFVVALNNDVTVTPTWLSELIRPAFADRSIGLCTGKLLFAHVHSSPGLSVPPLHSPLPTGEGQGEERPLPVPFIQNAGIVVSRDGRGHDRGSVVDKTVLYHENNNEIGGGQFDVPEEVFTGCGAALLIRSALLADVGGFDERFFAYYEDVDLSWRARLRGWRVRYVPTAIAYHVHRGTTAGWSDRFVYYTERNRLMMLVKCAPAERALLQLARATAAATLSLVRCRFQRRSSTIPVPPNLLSPLGEGQGEGVPPSTSLPRLAALASLAYYLPGLLADRARIQGRRRVGQAEIDCWFDVSPAIE